MPTKSAGDAGLSPRRYPRLRSYFNDELTETNVVLTLLPTPLTAATITMLMPIATKAYSMAVAPD
jgi:hypothetical protein